MNKKLSEITLVDSHCHLDFSELEKNIDHILNEADLAGVGFMQTICTRVSDFNKILNISKRDKRIFCSIGLHPLHVEEEETIIADKIVELSKHQKVIGIGETGLDFFYEKKARNIELQKLSFIEHIKAAQETGLPIIVHTRNADEDTVQILHEQYKIKPFKGVIHCFTASEWLAKECIKLGMYISASGIITFKSAKNILDIFAKIGLENILIETDSPYLAPIPHRGKTNMPSYVTYVAQKLSEAYSMPYNDIALITTNNFFRLFEKAKS